MRVNGHTLERGKCIHCGDWIWILAHYLDGEPVLACGWCRGE